MKRIHTATLGLLAFAVLSGTSCGSGSPTAEAKRYFNAVVRDASHPQFRNGSRNLEAARAGIDFTKETINGDQACVEIKLKGRPDHVSVRLRKYEDGWNAWSMDMNGSCDY